MTQDEMWELALKTSDKFLRHVLKEARKAGYNIKYNEEAQEFTYIPGKPTIDFESGKKVLKIIDNAPTVVAENATSDRPQGEWIKTEVNEIVCSRCGGTR